MPDILPNNETERLLALEEYNILDTEPETEFDDITRIAAQICRTPISLITLIDEKRQWFKSNYGFSKKEAEREGSFCGKTILQDTPFIVEDATQIDEFKNNAFVVGEPNIHFYAGIPLINPQGYALGSLCVIDNKPHSIDKEQEETLQALGRQIVSLLELKRKVIQLDRKQQELTSAYSDLEKFSYIASHDLKSPLNNIISLSFLLRDCYTEVLDEDGLEYLSLINESAFQLAHLVDGILQYSKSSKMLVDDKKNISLAQVVSELMMLLNISSKVQLSYPKEGAEMFTSDVAIKQILLNLVNNAIKYNDKEDCQVAITFEESKAFYTLQVIDNGPGIPEVDQQKMFDLFTRLKQTATSKEKEGTGIGLSVVKRLVEKLGGDIYVKSDIGSGTTFTFTIAK